MPAWLSISLLLGGTAVAIRAIVAVRRVASAGRQRRFERRRALDLRAAVQSRMGKAGIRERPGFEGLGTVDPVEYMRPGDRLQSPHLNLHNGRERRQP
jgi:hypothetical protein